MDAEECLRRWHDHDAELKHADNERCAVKITCHECNDTTTVYYNAPPSGF